MGLFRPFISTKFSKIKVRALSRSLLFISLNVLVLAPTAVMARSLNFIFNKDQKLSRRIINSITYSRGNSENCAPSIPSFRVEWLKLRTLTSSVNFHSASPRNAATQRKNFAPFLSNDAINNFSVFFSYFFLYFSFFN